MRTMDFVNGVGAKFVEDFFGMDNAQVAGPHVDAFNKAFEDKFKTDSKGPGVHTQYDAVMVIGLAMNVARELNGTAIRDAVRKASEGGTAIVVPARTNKGGPEKELLSGLSFAYGGESFAGTPQFAQWLEAVARESLDAFFGEVCKYNTGEVTLKLFKGNIEPMSRRSPNSLYSLDIASFTMGAEYDQRDARGTYLLPDLLADAPALYYATASNAALDARVQGWIKAVRARSRSGVTAPGPARATSSW